MSDYFTTSPEMKDSAEVTEGRAEVTEGRAENEREERDGREDIILRNIILLCRYIILMSKRRK